MVIIDDNVFCIYTREDPGALGVDGATRATDTLKDNKIEWKPDLQRQFKKYPKLH